MCSLAKRVLAGQAQAYSEAVTEFAAFSEIPLRGSTVSLSVHSPKLVGCTFQVRGREVVPAETKSLTASGKLSSKAMPKARAQEIYQRYVCGCALRVAREMFGLLPVDEALITATVDGTDDRTGNRASLPVLSVTIKRATIEKLNFPRLDPVEAMENFVHRGDAKAARRSGELVPIVSELNDKLLEAEAKSQRALSMAQQTKAGNVYIISNVGSFGEDVYKIGMTRRLFPEDRIRELSGASVPFEFDVHAMIRSDDAPGLEHMLHVAFADARINKVNARKEFFRMPLNRLREFAATKGLEVTFTMAAEAREYRETLALEKMAPVEREKYKLQFAQEDEELLVDSSLDEQ